MNKNKAGIYFIRNTISGKIYIGSTIDLSTRHYQHFRRLRNNEHANQHLQSSWNKHGEDVFVFEVIEHCLKDKLLEREQYYLDKWFLQNCFNINPVADKPPSRLGKRMSEEVKRKIGEAQKAIGNKPPGWKGKNRSKETKEKVSKAHKLKGIQPPTRKGMKHSEKTKRKISLSNKGKKRQPFSRTTRQRMSVSQRKPVLQFTKDGIFIREWDSALTAAKFLRKNYSAGISACCCAKLKTAHGFIWKFK